MSNEIVFVIGLSIGGIPSLGGPPEIISSKNIVLFCALLDMCLIVLKEH